MWGISAARRCMQLIVLAPATVQEMADFVLDGWQLAEKYRNPVMILSDGALGQMMEKVELREQIDRATNVIPEWATVGKSKDRERNIITSLFIQPEEMEQVNLRIQDKYKVIMVNEIRVQEQNTDDADFVIVAYGLSARIGRKVMEILRGEGMNVGLIRPITLWPYPYETIATVAERVKGFLSLELNAGQMVEDVRLAVNGRCPVEHYGRMGGIIPGPDEVAAVIRKIYANIQ